MEKLQKKCILNTAVKPALLLVTWPLAAIAVSVLLLGAEPETFPTSIVPMAVT